MPLYKAIRNRIITLVKAASGYTLSVIIHSVNLTAFVMLLTASIEQAWILFA